MLMRVENLYKTFGGHFPVIDDVSTQFEKGSMTSIIGPNGAGKTTLINLLSGRLQPDKGKIYFHDDAIQDLPIEDRVESGICRSFQITNIFPTLTVSQNIELPLIHYYRKTFKLFSVLAKDSRLKEEAHSILSEINLEEQSHLKAATLSHGEQRQLEIGIALATHPELIFLDEPTQGMNKVEKMSIMKNVVRLAHEGRATFVIVEHDMDVVFSVSSRIIVLHSGKIIADENPEGIKQNGLVRDVYLGEA